jgi:hypothetical protein
MELSTERGINEYLIIAGEFSRLTSLTATENSLASPQRWNKPSPAVFDREFYRFGNP